MKASVLQIASVTAIIQAVLMASFSLQNRKSSRTSNRIFASMMFILALLAGCSLYKSFGPLQAQQPYHRELFLLGQFAFLVGPLSYLYVRSLLDPDFVPLPRHGIHALPFVAAVLLTLAVFQVYDPFVIGQFRGRIYLSAAVLLQTLTYLVASLRIVWKAGLTPRLFLSYIDNSRLAWVRFFMSGYVVLWIMQFQLFVGWEVLENPPWCPYVRSLYFLAAFLLFNGMVSFALRRPEVFHQGAKYQSSGLRDADRERYQERLNALMDREKVYLNPSLTLTDIARQLTVHPMYVSQIINESFRQNFREYVNRYRIEESKRLLVQPRQILNITGIAYDSGFNSKSAFNRAFKKQTGMTPREYRRQVA
jgi:AraC-like DNA-binding protein